MNPYNVLGVKQSADYKTIRKKYIELAKKHHPDNFVFSNNLGQGSCSGVDAFDFEPYEPS